MSFLDLSRTGRRWLIVAAVPAVIAGAFTAGLIFGPREFVPALAQPAPEERPVSQDPATQPTVELDPMLPLSEVGEVTIEIVKERVECGACRYRYVSLPGRRRPGSAHFDRRKVPPCPYSSSALV